MVFSLIDQGGGSLSPSFRQAATKSIGPSICRPKQKGSKRLARHSSLSPMNYGQRALVSAANDSGRECLRSWSQAMDGGH
jgi:hypothetical protein